MSPFRILSDEPLPRRRKPRLATARLTQAEEWAGFAAEYLRDVAARRANRETPK